LATIREGNKSVMVVVDVQVGVMKEAWEGQRIIKNVARAVERARSEGVPVIWVQHSNQELPKGSVQWQLVPELVPAEGEVLIHKKYNSSFEQTSLDSELASLGSTHIVLAGAASNWCIRATAYGALDRGYDVTLVKDAHSTESMRLDSGLMIKAESVIEELNIAMKWLEYPGLKNGAATANDIEFAVPGSIKPAASGLATQ
jgi:nicotinamidase-related amidase